MPFIRLHNSKGIYWDRMEPSVDIGTLISRRPEIRGGRPCIAGTGVSVFRVAIWHQMGMSAEEIMQKYGHLSMAQVYAAITYYYANQAEIDACIAEDDRLCQELEKQYASKPRCA
jgi:uncharacterized protein (DUF433 family)